MPTKDIYLFDATNAPLQVKGIRVELYNATTGTLLDAQNSDDLNPGWKPSNEWGVQLTFAACNDPLDVYFSDPTYRYPGNTLHNLNGMVHGRIEVDLMSLPMGVGGQTPLTGPATPAAVERWIRRATHWTDQEQFAVRMLAFEFVRTIAPRLNELRALPDLLRLADNWAVALQRLGLSPMSLLQ